MTRSTPYYASIRGQMFPCATYAEKCRREERWAADKERRSNTNALHDAMEELRCDPVLGDAEHRTDPQRERFEAFLALFKSMATA